MINGMYLSTMGAMVQESRHATIANNLANTNTVGFKPDWTVFQSVPAESVIQGNFRPEIDKVLSKTGGGVWLDRTISNFEMGSLRDTGNPLDLALTDVPGSDRRRVFMVKSDLEGEQQYTRDGSFQINNEGYLVMPTGAYVTDASGGRIQIPEGVLPHITETGAIFDQEGNGLGQIGIVSTADWNKLVKIGQNLFRAEEGIEFLADQAGVHSGALEQSAAEPIREMTAMIEAHRIYETNMRFITMQDETLGQSVRRIAAMA